MRALQLVVTVLAIAGCHKASDDRPIEPGGGQFVGGGGDTSDMDALVDSDLDAAGTGPYRVCVISDLRGSPCATTGAAGFTVTLGTASATTAADGSFALTPPPGTGLVWVVTGSTIVTSLEQYGTVATIPAISTTTYGQLVDDVPPGVPLPSTDGSVVMAVVDSTGLTPQAEVAATVTLPMGAAPLSPAPYYDTTGTLGWTQTPAVTGADGEVWLVDVAASSVSITLTPASGTPTTFADIPVQAQAITFAVVELP